VNASPQPDRLGHLLSQARDDPPPGDVGVVGSWFSSRYEPTSLSRRSRAGASRSPLPRALTG